MFSSRNGTESRHVRIRDPDRDTIVAIATPPGTGALAIVRVSGPQAVAAADAAFRGRGLLCDAGTHTAHYGAIVQQIGRASCRERV